MRLDSGALSQIEEEGEEKQRQAESMIINTVRRNNSVYHSV